MNAFGMPFSICPASAHTGTTAPAWQPLPVSQWQWSYRFLERWLPGQVVVDLSSHSAGDGSGFVLVATAPGTLAGSPASPLSGCGFALYEDQLWTLQDKAVRAAAIQTRHDRYGLVDGSSCSQFGDPSQCTTGDSDNNGLWTSLVATANALRFAVTQEPEAAELAWHYYGGMKLLNRITGIRGLIARSAVSPNETHSGGGKWTNSTVPEYAGWQWKADASSDEVVGHTIAFTSMSAFMTNASEVPGGGTVAEAALLLQDVVVYITENGYRLIDFDGGRTTWGDWSPATLNTKANWSDEHGVNSLQMLSMLVAANGVADVAPADPARAALLASAVANLTAPGPAAGYTQNVVNAKIEAPCDVNYSDDELTFFPYFSWLVAAQSSNGALVGPLAPAGLHSLYRTFQYVGKLRSDLWNTIYAAAVLKWVPGPDAFLPPSVAGDVAWNLHTWPLDLFDWPTMNSHRTD